jgi:large conductance mechanosensitive channel
MLKEFRDFAMRGNVVDLAVGVIIGASFGAIINSLVKDILMPPLGVLLGKVDFANLFWVLQAGTPAEPYATLADAQAAGAVTMNYGLFINALASFMIVAFAIFLLIRTLNRLQKPAPAAEPTTRECPYCTTTISIKAKRCPNCTSQL